MKSYIKTGAGARIGFQSLKTQAVSKSKIKLSWKQIIGVDGYEIVRYNTKKKAYKKIKTLTNPKTVSYTDKGLKKRTKYKYKIRAYQKNGTKKVYGFYSNPKNGRKEAQKKSRKLVLASKHRKEDCTLYGKFGALSCGKRRDICGSQAWQT